MIPLVEVIRYRDLKRKLAKPQSQLHLVDDLLIVCTENEVRTQGYIYALEHNKQGMSDRWPWPYLLPDNYTARFGVYSPKHRQLIVSVSNLRKTLGVNSFLLGIDITTGKALWRFPENDELENLSAPTLVKDNIFVITNSQVLLLPLENPGQPIRSELFSFTPHWLYNGITSDETTIYVSVKEKGVVGISPETGKVQRHYAIPQGEARLAAAVNDQYCFVGTSNGQLIAFDKVSTDKKWVSVAGREITTGPLLSNDKVFIGTKLPLLQQNEPSYQINAFDLSNGLQHPERFEPLTLGTEGQFHAPLVLTPNNLLLCGANNGNLYALNSTTGQIEWQHFMQSEVSSAQVVSPNNDILIASRKGLINIVCPIRSSSLPVNEFQDEDKSKRKARLEFLRNHFNKSELTDLCDIELGINPEQFKTDSFNDFSRELLGFCERHGRINELVTLMCRLRPNFPCPH